MVESRPDEVAAFRKTFIRDSLPQTRTSFVSTDYLGNNHDSTL